MGYRSEVALTLKKEDGLELIRQAKENEIEEEWDGDDDSIRYKTQIEIELSIDPPGVLLSTSKLLGI